MEWPSHLSYWLLKNHVDPEKVGVVLQVSDSVTHDRIQKAFEKELHRQFIAPSTLTISVLKYCGLSIEIRCAAGFFDRLLGRSA
jgi:hypothetical protein